MLVLWSIVKSVDSLKQESIVVNTIHAGESVCKCVTVDPSTIS